MQTKKEDSTNINRTKKQYRKQTEIRQKARKIMQAEETA
jgi:hypothetical protein